MIHLIQSNATPIIGFLTLLSNIIFVGVVLAMLIHAGTRARLSALVQQIYFGTSFLGRDVGRRRFSHLFANYRFSALRSVLVATHFHVSAGNHFACGHASQRQRRD